MDVKAAAAKFVDDLLTDEAKDQPSDTVKPEELCIQLPEWYDEKEFNKARRFYWDNCFALSGSMLLGLVAVFSVPTILKVLIGSRRSSSVFTAYKRYLSTLLHTQSWFENNLKPGSISWRSLTVVRTRHLRASLASKLKGGGVVSQRDLALTQFGFIGFSILKPHCFGIRQLEPGQWDAYNSFWRVIGHMIGLEDRYNICRKTADETREVCRLLQERVFTPCLENCPEYFEHMSRVLLEGMSTVNPLIDIETFMYWVRYLADVPGYIFTETDRVQMQEKLQEHLKGKPLDIGVDAAEFIKPAAVEGLPPRPKRLLYYKDFDCLESVPMYKRLDCVSRYRLGVISTISTLYTWYLGRLYFNLNFLFSLYLMKYFPYLAMFKFGFKKAFVNIFVEDPSDDTEPKLNSYYYNENKPPRRWYTAIFDLFL